MEYGYDYSYENEVQCFYDWLETNEVGSSCILLWHALMHLYRKAGYPELFGVAISILEIKTGLKSTAIKLARNRLSQFGRIKWFERGGNKSANYKIIPFNTVVALADVKRPQMRPQYEPQQRLQSRPIIYNNNDNNIIDDFVVVNTSCDAAVDASVDVERPQVRPQSEPQSFRIVQSHYERHIGNLLSGTACMKITDFLNAGIEDSLICRALDKSIDSGARNWNYAERMLDNLLIKGILTVKDYEASEANRIASKRRRSGENYGKDGTNGRHASASFGGNIDESSPLTEGERLKQLRDEYGISKADYSDIEF